MSKISYKKIKEGLRTGKLIDYDDLFASYPNERQKRIKERARYLMAAWELRKLRQKARLSQQALAKKMDVKREFISRIESGEQNVTIATLYKIADAVGKEFKFTFK